MFAPIGVFRGFSSLAENGFLCDSAILLWRHCLYVVRKDTFAKTQNKRGKSKKVNKKKVVFTTSCKYSLLDYSVAVIGRGYACREWVMSFYFLRTGGFSLWCWMEFTSCPPPHTLNSACHSLEDPFSYVYYESMTRCNYEDCGENIHKKRKKNFFHRMTLLCM